MSSDSENNMPKHDYEGDYRPADASHIDPVNVRVEPADLAYLVQLADALNTTLDLQTLLIRTSELCGP
jgi:phosphoserine phosphatase RsbU/P